MADERNAADEQPTQPVGPDGGDRAGTDGTVGDLPSEDGTGADGDAGAAPGPLVDPLTDPDATARVDVPPLPGAGGVDGTRPLPPVDTPRWSARAGVRPRPAGADEWSGDAVVEDPYGGRSWFTPVIVAVVVLILLAVLGAGLYLIYRNSGRGGQPAPTPTAAPTTTAASSAAPSESPPTPTPSPSPPVVQVPVPAVVGHTEQEAKQLLDAVGLTYRLDTVVDGSVRPGTVLSVTPPAGTMVAKCSQVTLVVAAAPPSPPASPSPSPSGGTG